MSHTNKTVHYDLPQFIASDKGTWLGDLNTAFADIDTQMFQNEQATTQGNTTASNAKAIAEAAHGEVEALSAIVDRNTQKITTVKEVISSLQEDIGNADNLPTGTRDIVNAINTHENELQRLGGKIGSMETTVNNVQSSTTAHEAEIEDISNQLGAIENNLGSKSTLPNPDDSYAVNIKNNKDQIHTVIQANSTLNNKVTTIEESIRNIVVQSMYIPQPLNGTVTINSTTKNITGFKIGSLAVLFGDGVGAPNTGSVPTCTINVVGINGFKLLTASYEYYSTADNWLNTYHAPLNNINPTVTNNTVTIPTLNTSGTVTTTRVRLQYAVFKND